MAAAGATMAISTRPHEYRGPVVVAVGLHVAIVVLMSMNLSLCQREVVLPPVPAHVMAVMVERTSAAPVALPEPVPVPEAQPEPPKPKPDIKPPIRKPEAKPVPKKPDAKKPEPKATRPDPKVAAKPVEKPATREKPKPVTPDFSAMLDREEDALAARDAAKTAASQQAQRELSARALQDQKTVREYTALIRGEVEKRWNRPPGARNGMQTELRITLIPGGEVLDVQLVKSSGDTSFDRAAENAVRLAGRLPVPADPALFNTYFRQFKFLFRPEGLKQ